MNEFIPISRPSITKLEIEYVNEAVTSGWVSSLGKFVDLFETGFAEFCGAEYAVSTCNGTAAIHLALQAYGIGAGDEVIVPDLSFIATANAVVHASATPVFADVDAETLCLSPESVQACITPQTKAIMPVHLYGHPAEMDKLMAIAVQNNLIVIEDAAEAHGSTFRGKKVGCLGHCGTFSFYGNKNMTTGEGGAIVTNDADFAKRCKMLRDHAMDHEKRYWHYELGFNYRLTNIQAALGYAQLQRADELLGRRTKIFERYHARLADIEGLSLNRTRSHCTNSYWIVCAEIDGIDANRRELIMASLKQRNVDSRPYFYPMSDMPYFEVADTPVSHDVYQRGINLPTFFDLKDDQIDIVASALRETINDLA